jgi:hypothetical protein
MKVKGFTIFSLVTGDLLLNYLPHLHRPFTRYPHKIHPAGQGADVNLRFGSGDLAGDKLMTAAIHNGDGTHGRG